MVLAHRVVQGELMKRNVNDLKEKLFTVLTDASSLPAAAMPPRGLVLMDIILVINDLLENTLLHAYSEEERDAGALKIAETLKQMIQGVRAKARKWRFLDKVSPGRTMKRDPNIAALIRQLKFPEESKEARHEEEEPAEETEEWYKDDAVIEFDT